jgi:hypothetical protein
MTPEELLKEWESLGTRAATHGELIRWLTFCARGYAKAKKPTERRFWILQQLGLLSRFAESLCPGNQLKPVRDLVFGLAALDHGVQPDLLTRPYGAKPRPFSELRFRARMAAATQMYHESGMKVRSAARKVTSEAGTPDVDIGQVENWRQALRTGDPESDIGAYYYYLWTHPRSGVVVGPSESASGTDDPQADIDAAVFELLHPGERVGWSGGALRTKIQYAEWLARTAVRIRSIG